MTTATGFVSPEEERRLRQLTAAEDTQGQETSELSTGFVSPEEERRLRQLIAEEDTQRRRRTRDVPEIEIPENAREVRYDFLPEGTKVFETEDGKTFLTTPLGYITDDPGRIQRHLNYYVSQGRPTIPRAPSPPTIRGQRVSDLRGEPRQLEVPQEMTSMLPIPQTEEEIRSFEAYTPTKSFAAETIAGLPFLGPQAVSPFLGTDPTQQEIFAEEQPTARGAAQIIGGGAGMAGEAYLASPFLLARGAGKLKRTASRFARGAAYGGSEAISSSLFEEHDNLLRTLGEGIVGATVVGGANVIFPQEGSEKVASYIGNLFRGSTTGKVQRAFGLENRAAAQKLITAYENQDLQELGRLMAGSNANVAAFNPALRQVLEVAIREGSEAGETALAATKSQLNNAWNDFSARLDEAFGAPIPLEQRTINDISRSFKDDMVVDENGNVIHSSPETGNLFQAAYADGVISYDTPSGANLRTLLSQEDPETIVEANNILAARYREAPAGDGVNPRLETQIKFEKGPNGLLTFENDLSVEQSHAVVQALRMRAAKNVEDPGAIGVTPKFNQIGAGLVDRSKRLSDALKGSSAAFDTAVTQSARDFQRKSDIELGMNFLKDATGDRASNQTGIFARNITSIQRDRSLTAAEKAERISSISLGIRSSIDNQLDTIRMQATRADIDDSGFKSSMNYLQSPAVERRLRLVLPNDQTNAILQQIEDVANIASLERVLTKTNAASLAQRVAETGESLGVESSALNNLAVLPVANQKVTAARLMFDPREVDEREVILNRQIWDEVAVGISNLTGQSALRAANIAQKVARGQEVSQNQADFFVRFVLTPTFLAASRKIVPEAEEE